MANRPNAADEEVNEVRKQADISCEAERLSEHSFSFENPYRKDPILFDVGRKHAQEGSLHRKGF